LPAGVSATPDDLSAGISTGWQGDRQAGTPVVRLDKPRIAEPPMAAHRPVQRRDDPPASPLTVRLESRIAAPAVAADGGVGRHQQLAAPVICAKIARITDPAVAVNAGIGRGLDPSAHVAIPGKTRHAVPTAPTHDRVVGRPYSLAAGLGDLIARAAHPFVAANIAVCRRGDDPALIALAHIACQTAPTIADDDGVSRCHNHLACRLFTEPVSGVAFDAVGLNIAVGRCHKALACASLPDKTGHASPHIANNNGVGRRAHSLAAPGRPKRESILAPPAPIGGDGIVRTRARMLYDGGS